MAAGEKKKRVWIVAQYAMPPQYESRLRHIKFAHYMALNGWEVRIFASSFMHNMNLNLIDGRRLCEERRYDDLDFVHIRTCGYRGHGVKRVLSTLQFYMRFLRVARRRKERPDVVIGGLVPLGGVVSRYAARVGAAHVVQIQDLWPQTMVDFGMVSPRNPLVRLLCRIERNLYRRADAVVFSMRGGGDYIREKRWDTGQGGPIDLKKVFYINNGVDLCDFDRCSEQYVLQDEDLGNQQIRKVVYIGSIQMANDIGRLVDAAALLRDRTDVRFLIYGDGSDREALERRVRDEGLTNVVLKQKWIDPKYVPYLLCRSSVNILNYRSGFGRYGGSQSKLFQYMAAGRPICCNIEMPYCLITEHRLGVARRFGSAADYAAAIEELLNMERGELEALYGRSRRAVREFDYPVLTGRLLGIMDKLTTEESFTERDDKQDEDTVLEA